ncbi:hypothetical protein C2E20_8356 [Micractinium conductrix]|uniref:Uncharacterized protein n=1 Tax=Micractinium conductrix TaxID=554055 RepID=A0A2P6V1P0_9CHLO|nr:hypothetical protein C2E20_8356 [Micractinium conductrix]|eukprot:PSC68012.1 hypothetical protein C2E20_8356 [Micractinium conductrix]
METTGGLTKRLAFDELGAVDLAGPEPEALIQALRHPTVEGFSRALELLQGTARARFAAVQETAVEASDAVGEADLRRLKRQFSSLKNTFLHFEVKNEFLAELLDGRPHGDEGELLQHFEAEVEASVAHLRQLKAANEEAQGAITQVVGQIAAAHDAFERQRAALTGELARLAAEVGAHEAGAEAHATALPELPEGPGEAECHDALAASAAEARQLEAAIAAAQAEAEELGAAIAAEREEAEALRAQLGDLEGQNAAAGERVESNARFLSTAQWCDEVAGTITQLGGLSLLHVQPDALHLKLVTAYPTAAVRGADPGPCATADHELSLQLLPGAGNTVYGVTLEPADVEVADIAEAAREGRRPADFVVREVTARLGALLHRRALVEEAAAQFDLASSSTDAGIVRARLGSGVEAEARLVGGWPAGPDVVHITQVSGAADAVKAAKAEALRFEGRGLLAALEAVQRELA